MVKNLPTIERSTRIRFGKNATEDQAEGKLESVSEILHRLLGMPLRCNN